MEEVEDGVLVCEAVAEVLTERVGEEVGEPELERVVDGVPV